MTQLYATNLGAGGIDVRCAPHLEDVLADSHNIAAGVTREDYIALAPGDPDAVCEACFLEADAARDRFRARALREHATLIRDAKFGSAAELDTLLHYLDVAPPAHLATVITIGERLLFAVAFARRTRGGETWAHA